MSVIRYGHPYIFPPPIAVSSFRSFPDHPFYSLRGPDFARINAAQGSTNSATQRCEERWGSRRYFDPLALVLEEDGLVGLLKAQPNKGRAVIAETIDAFIEARGVQQFVLQADETGYTALLSHNKTTLHVRYFAGDGSAILHRYGDCKTKPAQYRRNQLQKEAPKPNEEGWRNGTLTEDIGLTVYDHVPFFNPDSTKVCIRIDRKKPCTYSPGTFLPETSTRSVMDYLRTQLPYSFSTSFPLPAERDKLRDGEPVSFTIRFKGYRAVGSPDVDRDRQLITAYTNSVRLGMRAVLENVYAALSAHQEISFSPYARLLQHA